MQKFPILILLLLIISVVAMVSSAETGIEITPVGNGTVIVVLPDNSTCNVSYRLPGDDVWLTYSNQTGNVTFDLPYGKYIFYVSCDNGESLQTVIENKPKYLEGEAVYILLITLLFVVLHVWRRSVITFAFSSIFVFYFTMNYLNVFSALTQSLILIGYLIAGMILMTKR